MTLGTGAVKITPAHSHEDYECAKRHGMTFINLLNDDGTFNENAGPFQGMKRFHARSAVVEALKERGLYVDTQEHPMELPVCSKSGDIIEIILKPQWWIDLKDASAEALRQTKTGLLNISPKSSAAEFSNWLSNPQDWCISRQLWWGHRIPAYLLSIDGAEPDHALPRSWVVGRTEEEAMTLANKIADGRPFKLQQDEDVLDTWFSAGLWPFAIMGWPEATADLDKFYPTQMLETGWDILPFWVARMVLLGITLTGQMPFKEVLCHGLIRDAEGRKMSKSLGNVVDPVDLIEGIELDKLQEKLKIGNLPEQEVKRALQGQRKLFPKGIPQCGTDALRFGLCNSMTGGKCSA
jgi:valyl-tRNA synthetase